ncbi:MAG: AmmeMemoRadiSam system radical SAM enzyme [Candidatus Bathyarchaeota archaeon]|nr:AmmeMemoRadiSam system radical SAM enzyme [Candidatus Bathyarchaeota archaeon]MDW8040041.1 AmmeMemoRadiSam system radical SAM enzyme [Nitrososphaerota archaeon]
MREAMLYERLENEKVKCNLCGRRCVIKSGETGFCLVRKNEKGVLYSLVYGKAVSACVDPIGKKPLFHFNPGASVMSIATVGCNFRCQFCDNWTISQEKQIAGRNFSPEEVVKATRDNGCQGISYTYTEPTIFFEYAYETAKLAHQVGFFNTFVTNGYMTPEAVRTIAPYLDAATVDFKGGGDPEFYKNFSSVPSVAPIFECLKEMKRRGIHIEITNLLVPKIGDSIDQIAKIAEWIKEAIGEDTPFHLLRFHPDYKLMDIPSTPIQTLEKAYAAAKSAGLNFVYIGNVPGHPAENTYCPDCNELLIKRFSFEITRWNLTKDMRCPVCGREIPIKGRLYPSGYAYPYALF